MILEKRSLVIYGSDKHLNAVRYMFKVINVPQMEKVQHREMNIKISNKEIKKIHFIELSLTTIIENHNAIINYLKKSPHLLFNESTNLISELNDH